MNILKYLEKTKHELGANNFPTSNYNKYQEKTQILQLHFKDVLQ